jgi:hypothetical protein
VNYILAKTCKFVDCFSGFRRLSHFNVRFGDKRRQADAQIVVSVAMEFGRSREKKELNAFSNFILENYPTFSAEKFTQIDRCTIPSILVTPNSFFIVLIPFHCK